MRYTWRKTDTGRLELWRDRLSAVVYQPHERFRGSRLWAYVVYGPAGRQEADIGFATADEAIRWAELWLTPVAELRDTCTTPT